jgi:hypothetical protein
MVRPLEVIRDEPGSYLPGGFLLYRYQRVSTVFAISKDVYVILGLQYPVRNQLRLVFKSRNCNLLGSRFRRHD